MKSVTMYTTPACHFCHAAKKFFKEHSIAYTEKDVAADVVARTEMIGKSRQMGVPVIDVGGTIIVGFNEGELRKELQIA